LISLKVNGAFYDFTHPVSPAELVEFFNLSEKKIAIELNGSVLSKSDSWNLPFKNGDKIEIITAVGGG
tara:strand:- start:1 stop:204 length:204 start_codon:yes stop_codon:yes gene_type:complete